MQMTNRYRLAGRSLFRKSADHGGAFIHCAIVPVWVRGIAQAVRWFEASEEK